MQNLKCVTVAIISLSRLWMLGRKYDGFQTTEMIEELRGFAIVNFSGLDIRREILWDNVWSVSFGRGG